MFDQPAHTLFSSLKKVVDNPKEYLADVCCRFQDVEIWAHTGILLLRCPSAFGQRFLPYLVNKGSYDPINDSIVTFDESISSSLFKLLLLYWYTAHVDPDLPEHICQQLNALEKELDIQLLPRPAPDNYDTFEQQQQQQLVQDLNRMRLDEIGCDINLILPLNSSSSDAITSTTLSIPAHRFILASQSTYFYAMFCTDFCESQNKVVQLTDRFFTPMVMQVILNYLYSDTVCVPPPPQLASICNFTTISSSYPPLSKIQKLTLKKHTLRTLQMTFAAADYLGQMKTLGYALLHAMTKTCDGFRCLCDDCVLLLPSMLSLADKKKEDPILSPLRATLVTLYSDPTHAIQHLWSQKPFAILVHSMIPSAASMMKTLDSSIALDDDHKPKSTLIFEIAESTYANVTKHNAIHVLHALHLCFSKLRSADLLPTWSLPTLDLLDPILQLTVSMVSQNFDFYCVEYPILVSCVDGIGCGFSIDFLDFLLNRVLDQGIQDANAGIIYQGIVKDLIGRQETVKNIALDDVLLNARVRCTAYLARRWLSVKSLGGFRSLEKATMRQLSDDIGIPYRTLTKPFDTDLLSLFSFRPKPSKHALKLKSENEAPYPSTSKAVGNGSTISFGRRRSFGNPRNHNAASSSKIVGKSISSSTVGSRPRSHSAGSAPPFRSTLHSTKTDPSSGYVNYNTLNALSTQPLIHLLSMETEARRYQQEISSMTDNDDAYRYDDDETSERLLDALLPMEKITPVVNNKSADRSTKLKFEIPSGGPTHAKSPLHPSLYNQLLSPMDAMMDSSACRSNKKMKMKKRGLSPKRSKWNLGSTSGSDISEDEELGMKTMQPSSMITPMIGARVELRRRPLPTFGTIQYIGPVSFAKGTWIGLELESRLGKNNGCVAGVTYFRTDPQRGLFVKQDDFIIISIPSMTM
ncbi:uncharacterized protein BX664DRAFT_340739 [Halteromyces radiatus]|uniref:uncharacterized protein n=1 Tax=Halteromyces radiatus TaxID=101107 RepID=UPI00221E4366|nr:uncharacterized protein BX664DRAFT_340739 [Halteromyces radiatus]KAI8081572.1 hypothetical protein BX664DRAFT_340739 [Halteromyces radiatus]